MISFALERLAAMIAANFPQAPDGPVYGFAPAEAGVYRLYWQSGPASWWLDTVIPAINWTSRSDVVQEVYRRNAARQPPAKSEVVARRRRPVEDPVDHEGINRQLEMIAFFRRSMTRERQIQLPQGEAKPPGPVASPSAPSRENQRRQERAAGW